ncbi:MAG: VOC family protein [Planctomycetota bacterium]
MHPLELDHVEIYVTDRAKATEWYAQVLGFHPIEAFADWAEQGPLMLGNQHSQMIALFPGEAQGAHPIRGHRRIAFRVTAEGFAEFIQTSKMWRNPPLGRESIQDHQRAISVYFTDPFGNPLEVTTYDDTAARAFVDQLPTAE